MYEPCIASSFTDFFANGTSPIRDVLRRSAAFSLKRPMSTQKLSGLMSWPSARSKFVQPRSSVWKGEMGR